MLKLIKKDGRIEEFAADKIKVCLANTAGDINFMLNKKDIDIIAEDIVHKIVKFRGEDGLTSSFEVISLVLNSLHNMGFVKLADTFYKGSFSNRVRAK